MKKLYELNLIIHAHDIHPDLFIYTDLILMSDSILMDIYTGMFILSSIIYCIYKYFKLHIEISCYNVR